MDLNFTLSDLIIILGAIGGWITGYISRIRKQDAMQNQIDTLQKSLTEHKDTDKAEKKEFFAKYQEHKVHLSNGRKAEKKELMDHIEKQVQVTHARIDRVRDDNIKSYEKLEKRIDEMEIKIDSSTEKIISAINSKK